MRWRRLRARKPPRRFLASYVRGRAEPAREIGRICDFLGLHADPVELLANGLGNTGEVGLGDWKTYESITPLKVVATVEGVYRDVFHG